MTKQEMELSQAFTELELMVNKIRTAGHATERLGSQSHKFWFSYLILVEDRLADFKTKFYKIMLEMDEPE